MISAADPGVPSSVVTFSSQLAPAVRRLRARRAPTVEMLEQVTALADDPRPFIRSLLQATCRPNPGAERRREQRYPCPRLFMLVPIDQQTLKPVGEAVTVVGKHISESGISFFHPETVPYRWILAVVENDGKEMHFVVDLEWCRFTKQGWYESGGRIFGVLTTPPTS
ncbi:MAG: hypothetical protein JSS27_13235 [Planctomycetes bacterium]|nr:hypothetical protein [Planctomycetota bacterium]